MPGHVGDARVGDHLQPAREDLVARGVGPGDHGGLHRQGGHHQYVVARQRLVVGLAQLVGEVLRHRVVLAAVPLDRRTRGEQHELDRLGELRAVGAPLVAVVLDDLRVVEPLPVQAVAVEVDHLAGRALGGDDVPDPGAVQVPRDRDVLDGKARTAQRLGGRPHRVVDGRLGVGVAEALGDDPDPQAGGVAGERGQVVVRHEVAGLAGVVPIRARDHVQHQRGVGDRAGDRADVVDRRLDRERAGVGHQAPGRLVPDGARVGARDAHRATLVAAGGRVDDARHHERRAARGRAARRARLVPRVADGPGLRGVRAAGEAEVLAHGLAGDGGPRREDAGDDGGVAQGV